MTSCLGENNMSYPMTHSEEQMGASDNVRAADLSKATYSFRKEDKSFKASSGIDVNLFLLSFLQNIREEQVC